MHPFETHRGRLAALRRANVDTDQIIPKQFLKSIRRTGFGKSLFFDWRYGSDGAADPAFALNDPRLAGASILVAGNNFGCGSSREHAVWALVQYGFRVLVAPWRERGGQRVPGFADIFRNNAVKNGLLTVELSGPEVEDLFARIEAAPGLEATVDLAAQRIELHGAGAPAYAFAVDAAVKDHLLRGLDDIALTMEHEADIAAFEAGHSPPLVPAGG